MSETKVVPLFKDNYLARIKNSVGSKTFSQFFANVSGQRKDILNSGDLSCAQFVSSILYLCDLIKRPHSTVSGTVADMLEFGWKEIDELKVGAVIHWDKVEASDGMQHEHVGFYMGEDKAISNDYHSGTPQEHHVTFGEVDGQPTRKILKIYWIDLIEQN